MIVVIDWQWKIKNLPVAESNALLDGVRVLVVTETLDGDDMLAIDGAERGQAGVDVQVAIDRISVGRVLSG